MPSTISNQVLKTQWTLSVWLVLVIGLTILFSGCYGKQEATEQSADQAEQRLLEIDEKLSGSSADADRDFIPPGVNLLKTPDRSPKLPEINPPFLSDSIEQEVVEYHPFPLPDSWKRLGKHEIWIDFNAKQVILGGIICLNQGLLEMFACPVGTKEHESVVAVLAPAIEMHSALLAVGAVPGKPARWEEERGYIPPSGSVIDIQVRWLEDKTETIITRDSRQMVQNSLTEEAMDHDWIFGGSVIFDDPETGERFYYANSGEMICVSNFPSAAIDVGFESSSDNSNLMFQAFSENIPKIGTKVYLILTPGAYREGD